MGMTMDGARATLFPRRGIIGTNFHPASSSSRLFPTSAISFWVYSLIRVCFSAKYRT